MNKLIEKNASILNKIIVGRVEPHIYAFSTNSVPNYLKVGDTYRSVSTRLNEWREVYPELKKEYEEKSMINEEIFFRDYSVHQYLENDLNKERINKDNFPNLKYVSKEFFKNTDVVDVQAAIKDIQTSYEKHIMKYKFYNANDKLSFVEEYSSTGYWEPRPNQKEVIENFKQAITNGRTNLLMYAVMRFGKSFTSMCCALEMNAKVVLIVSAKADVKEEWRKTIQSADNFNQFKFLDSQDLLNENIIHDTLKSNKVAIFLTLQDLQGTKIKEKHKELFSSSIDLLLIDETHFGVRTESYGEVLRDKREDSNIDFEEADKQIKVLKSKVRIHLSGTPYRILMSNEFEKEDIIAFYQFSDIVDEQEKWDREHLNKDEVEEWDNPYYGFPQMIRFAFNPSESIRKKIENLKSSGISSSFSEMLKPKSTTKQKDGSHKVFIYEKEILELLEIIDGSKEDENVLGFLDYDKIKNGKMCHHMVIVLPYRASCDALENIIVQNKHIFKNLNEYEIINISGVDNITKYKKVDDVKNKISSCENKNIKTITLTVNRMLTGSTVEEWDTMIYLKDTSSPQEYDQSVFRLQNAFIKEYLNKETGKIIKFNKKPQTLLVDFNPNRMFMMQERKSKIYNVNTDKLGNSKLETRLAKELKISPIISMNMGKIHEIQPANIMDAISKYSKERGIYEETNDIPVDFSLLSNQKIMETIDKQGMFGTRQGIEMPNTFDLDDEEFFIPDNVKQDNGNKKIENSNKFESQKEENKKNIIEKKFRTYYARILFYAFLTKNKVDSLEDMIDSIDSVENRRISKNISVNKNMLILIRQNIDPFILSQLDYKIRNINKLGKDPHVDKLDSALMVINKFDKLSDSEVSTPQKICIDMYKRIGIKNIEDIIIHDGKILDIASKEGEFAVSLYSLIKNNNLIFSKIKDNFYSIPTSGLAYEFTRLIYEILGFKKENISEKFNTYDLIKKENNNIDYDKISAYLKQNKPFSNINLENDILSEEEINHMKFDIIVGNPPYQVKTEGYGKQATPIYNNFVELSKKINPEYLSLLIPSRWFAGGMGLDAFRNKMINDVKISHIVDYPNSHECFENVDVTGGVCYFLRKKEYNGLCEFTTVNNGKESVSNRKLNEYDIFIRDNEGEKIVKKINSLNINNGKKLSEFVSPQRPFGIPTNYKPVESGIPCQFIQRIGKKFANAKDVSDQNNLLDKWKFIVPRSPIAGQTDFNKPIRFYYSGNSYILKPGECCSESFIVLGAFDSYEETKSFRSYIFTKIIRFLLLQTVVSQDILRKRFCFVPALEEYTGEYTDERLMKMWNITDKEMAYIDSRIVTSKVSDCVD